MGTFRVHKEDNFTIINNSVFRNKNLSWKAKGILAQMLSLPEEWDYSEAGLSKLAKDGITSTKSALKELEKEGYLFRSSVRDAKGHIVDVNYDIYESPEQGKKNFPTSGFPTMDKPTSDKPTVGNPTSGQPIMGFPIPGSPISDFKHNKELSNINNVFNKVPSSLSDDDIRELREYGDIFDDIYQVIQKVFSSKTHTIRVQSTNKKREDVQKVFNSINKETIESVIHSIEEFPAQMSNKESYIRTLLYNAATQPKKEKNKPKKQNTNAFNDFEQRDYDYSKLESMLIQKQIKEFAYYKNKESQGKEKT